MPTTSVFRRAAVLFAAALFATLAASFTAHAAEVEAIVSAQDLGAAQRVQLVGETVETGRTLGGEVRIEKASLDSLALHHGHVQVDQSGLDLQLAQPARAIAFEVDANHPDAIIEIAAYVGEHLMGRSLLALGGKPLRGASSAPNNIAGIRLPRSFDRVVVRSAHSPDGSITITLKDAWVETVGDLALRGESPLDDNDRALTCQVALGVIHNFAFGATLVPGGGVLANGAVYFSNLALKFCKTFIKPPPDKFLRIPAESCEAGVLQTHMVSDYENALGISIGYNRNWGNLGSPTVYHHNTEVDVMLLYNTPIPLVSPSLDLGFWAQGGSFEATDRIWEQCNDAGSVRYSQLDGEGPFYECPIAADRQLLFPVGETQVRWRANVRMSPLDVFPVPIPGSPSGSKLEPWRTIGIRAISEALLITSDLFFDGWRINNSRDVYQQVTVFDEVPPTITPLPFNQDRITAVLVDDRIEVTIEADEAGGVSARRYEQILSQMYGLHDDCERAVSISASYPNPDLRGFWPVSTLEEPNVIEITWTARDPGPNLLDERNETTTTMLVEVVDTQPPAIVPPDDIVEVDSGSVNELGLPLVFDFVDLDPIVSNDATLPLGLGLHHVTWTVTDASGNSDSGVQVVNVKASNLEPTPIAQTGADRAEAISFEPTPIRLQGTDPDGDPLRFFIDEAPDDGFFVAPLYPYFVEDFRIEQSISDGELETLCGPDGQGDPFHLEFPSQPEFLTVTDDGRTYVVDKGYIVCSSFFPDGFERRDRIAVIGNDGSLINARQQFDLRDVVLDAERERVFATSLVFITDDGLTELTVFNLDLEPLVSYRMDSIEDREDGSCPTLSDFGCALLGGQSAVIDDNDLIYVMDKHGEIIVLDGTLPPDFDCAVDCTHEPTFVAVLNDDGSPGTGGGGKGLGLDAEGQLYAGRRERLFRYTPSFVASDGLSYPGTLEGWLGRCDVDLAPGDQAVCDVANHRSLGFSCSDATCAVDPAYNNDGRVTCGGSSVGQERWGRCPGQFSGTPAIDLAPDGTVYVADTGNARIQRFSTKGFFAGQAESTCDGSCFVLGDFGNPENITVNSSRFYIIDPATNLLHISLLTPFVDIGPDYADLEYQSNNDFGCVHPADCVDSFTFRVSDGVRDPVTGQPVKSDPADVEIEVMRNFRPPFATPGISVVMHEDTLTPIVLDGSDPDPLDTLNFQIVEQPQNGSILVVSNQAHYTPDLDFFGDDSFTFAASDGVFTSAPESVMVTVAEVNDPPVIQAPDDQTVGQGYTYTLDLEFTDPDPDEQHLLAIDWGDGVVETEGFIDSDGTITGPIVSQSGNGPGKISAEHIYTSAGTKTVEVCLTDRVSGDDGAEVPTPGLSLVGCEIFPLDVIEGLDLEVSAVANTERALPNQLVSVAFNVLNNPPDAGAPLTATGVTLEIDFPAVFAPGSLSLPGNCSVVGLTATCDLGTLDPGWSDGIDVVGRVDLQTPPGTLMVYEARATVDQVDVNPENTAAHVITVSPPADLYVDALEDAFLDKPDSNPGDGTCASEDNVCTLRAAVEEANAQPGLTVVALGTGVYTLTEGLIEVTEDLVLVGNGAMRTIIDGSDGFRALYVSDENVTLRIEDLTLARGGVQVTPGDLVVRRARFTGATQDSFFGGAVFANNLIDIRDTVFDDNQAVDGAAVWGNPDSHGIFENVIVTGNRGGGLTLRGTNYTLNHVTITGNVGGVYLEEGGALNVVESGAATISGSIVAGNYSIGGPVNCLANQPASLVSLGGNAWGDLDGCAVVPDASDIFIADGSFELTPLRFEGGRIPYVAPREGSAVIDAMQGPDCPLEDALGVTRPEDGDGDGQAECDIGAVEFVPGLAPPRLVATPDSVNFGEVAPGGISAPVVITLENAGELALVVGDISFGGVHGGDFMVQPGSDQCSGVTLDPGAQCTFVLVYGPAAGGVRRGLALISSSDPAGVRSISLRGTSGVLFLDGFEGD